MYLRFQGYIAPTIATLLRKEGTIGSRRGIAKFFKRYEETCTIARRAGSGRPRKITGEVKQLVEKHMRADDETTAYQLHALFTRLNYSHTEVPKDPGVDLQRECLLPTYSLCQQGKKASLGAPPPSRGIHWFSRRCLDRRMHCTARNSLTILLSQARRTSQE